jgi:hypothetical protein
MKQRPGPLALAAALLCSALAMAADDPPEVVMSRRAVTIARALSYDATLADRAGGEVLLVVLFKKKHPGSDRAAEVAGKAFKQLETLRIAGSPFRRLVVPFAGPAELEQLVHKEGVDALYLCDGLEEELPAIKQITRQRKVLTLGATEAQARAGVSLAVVVEGSKTVIVVNWTQSREEGASFGSDLLRLAKVVR